MVRNTHLSFVDPKTTLIVGQSHGGLTTLAYGASNPDPSVKGLVNFAGGLRQNSCSGWRSALVNAFYAYAKNTQLPSLWFYGDNDSFFPKELFNEMYTRYNSVNSSAKLVAYGTFAEDSHRLFGSKEGRAIWEPHLESFMRQIGLSVKIIYPEYKP